MSNCIELGGLHGLRHVAMSCDNLYCNFFILGVNGIERIVRVYRRSPEPDMNLKCCKRV